LGLCKLKLIPFTLHQKIKEEQAMTINRQFNRVGSLFAKLSRLPSLRSFATCGAILATIPVNPVFAAANSPSSYQQSCKNMYVSGATLGGQCKTRSGTYIQSPTILIRGIWNNEGVLSYTSDPTKASSYQTSCQSIQLLDKVIIQAACRKSDGSLNVTKIKIRGIWNNNGRLSYS
jgi:hypothetical protein